MTALSERPEAWALAVSRSIVSTGNLTMTGTSWLGSGVDVASVLVWVGIKPLRSASHLPAISWSTKVLLPTWMVVHGLASLGLAALRTLRSSILANSAISSKLK
jgi:hypothetical protein